MGALFVSDLVSNLHAVKQATAPSLPAAESLPGEAARAARLLEAALTQDAAASERWSLGAGPELTATLRRLDQLDVGADAAAACILHAMVLADLAPSAKDLATFPVAVRELLDGQQAAERIWQLHAGGVSGGAEGLRRLLLAIIRDLRVVFILLARQAARLQQAADWPEPRRRALAQLTFDIHAPLANRLGIWQLKWELEDLAFRYLQPETYKRIARLLDERRNDREVWIRQAREQLETALGQAGISAQISGRPKHIYSIWRKMQRKGVEFSELYDVRALRVLVADVPACYLALGAVHALWSFIPGEFDDYIANPKGNNYQSLHTAVIGPQGRPLEVQIRTPDMHAQAELGVAAHWRYKEGGGGDASFERKVAWMRQLLESRDEHDDDALMAGFRTDIMDDRVYLLTPKGEVKDLPRGATVLDFAYHVHTDVGHRCRGAKVNGRIVPLNHPPETGDRIEILTGKVAEPRRDWLSAHTGYLTTHRAREKVRAWFKRIDLAQNVAAGRALLERELKRVGLSHVHLDELPALFKFKSQDELHEALALGDVTPGHIARILHERSAPPPVSSPPPAPKEPARETRGNLIVEGVGNLLTALARCCQPLPGDPITGFITRGRGVSVHRSDCPQLARLRARDGSRLIEVEWGTGSQSYEVDVLLRGYDRKDLLKDVTAAVAAAKVHLLGIHSRLDEARGIAEMNLGLRVADFGQLSTLLDRLLALPNVVEARRIV
ncbi:RelA/SpoT family (P)ppGpp synthetase [Dokdonella koreensis DS-123]|uniref:GTP pyrophosphokinase n=1 Tax=Dokdonella koreensis DS-123 TaxID=1300342 RepID=A0A167H600_9GAMM|nr:RelA/SpoT family (P)ppGpp synthetase [Dokdonella koreensis DS-123]